MCACVREWQNVSVREWSHDMLRATEHVFVGVGPSSGCVAERADGMRAGVLMWVPVPVAGDACRDRVRPGGVAGLDGVRIHDDNRCR